MRGEHTLGGGASRVAGRAVALWIGSALTAAAASLLVHRALAFDPEAWVVWGREVWSLSVDTSAGPSWKPLPVCFTAPFAAFGDGAPWAWLVVARAGALLAVAGVARMAYDLGGRRAAWLAGAMVVAMPWWWLHGALGNAEPLLVACCAWAVVAQRAERGHTALALVIAAALIRVEVWPFAAVYALWRVRGGTLPWAAALGAGAGVLALWVVPDLLASGLSSASGAAKPVGETPAFPFGAVWVDLAVGSSPFALVAALLSRRWLWVGGAAAYTLLVAVMAQAGFAGNPRYLIPAFAAVLAAAALAPRLAVPLAAAAVVWGAAQLPQTREDLAHREAVRAGLDALAPRLASCATVTAGPDQRALIARRFRQSVPRSTARDPVLRLDPDAGRWSVLRRC